MIITRYEGLESQLESTRQELSLTKQKFEIQESAVKQLERDNAALSEKKAALLDDNKRLNHALELAGEAHRKLLAKSEAEKGELRDMQSRLKTRNAELKEQLIAQEKSSEEKLAILENAKKSLIDQFENLANRIFEQKSEKFAAQNQKNLAEILHPFQVEIGAFKHKVETFNFAQGKDSALLRQELNRLHQLNQTMSKDTQDLTRALKGDKKLQGDWGEVILERVLEASGLRKGHEYETQNTFKNDEAKRLRPDVIVHLPDGKDVIIDAKVSLVDYEACMRAESDGLQSGFLKKHIESVRQHVNLLSAKNYESLSSVNSLDFILMFMPIEAAFALAFKHEQRLFEAAFEKRIIIVTPTTLLATLGTIRNLWKYEKMNKNAQEISDRAGRMYDKFSGFCKDIEEIGDKIDKTQEVYKNAYNKLVSGKGNLVGQALKLKRLGVQPKKELPNAMLEQGAIET